MRSFSSHMGFMCWVKTLRARGFSDIWQVLGGRKGLAMDGGLGN